MRHGSSSSSVHQVKVLLLLRKPPAICLQIKLPMRCWETFTRNNPNKHTAVRQAGLLREWIAYPGDNSLAITQVIYDGLESIVTGDADDMESLQQELSEEVASMLPN